MQVKALHMSLAIVALIAFACCQNTDHPGLQPSIATPGQHWIQGERLKKVMGQIRGLHEAFPKGLPEDAESPEGLEARRALVELAAVANALADTAKNIPTAVEKKRMSDTDRHGFVAEAVRLHDQAIVLRDAARANQIEPLQGMRNDIDFTCISCHSRYRDISGDLNSHKALAPAFDREITAEVSR